MNSSQQPYRYNILQVYKNIADEHLEKIGYTSRIIKNKYNLISFIYGMSLYGKIEQIFLNYYLLEMESLIDFFKQTLKNQDDTFTKIETKQLQIFIGWLEIINEYMLKQNDNYEEFIEFYKINFFNKVFCEYDLQQKHKKFYYIEDCICFANSLFILNYFANKKAEQNNENKDMALLFHEKYLNQITSNKITILTEILDIGLRVYLDCVDEIQALKKTSSDSRMFNLSMTFIYDINKDQFRIGYDQPYSSCYQHYIFKKQFNQKMIDEFKNGQTSKINFQEKMNKIIYEKYEKVNNNKIVLEKQANIQKEQLLNFQKLQKDAEHKKQEHRYEEQQLESLFQQEQKLQTQIFQKQHSYHLEEQRQKNMQEQEETIKQHDLWKQDQNKKYENNQNTYQQIQLYFQQEYQKQQQIPSTNFLEQSCVNQNYFDIPDFLSQTLTINQTYYKKYLCEICCGKIEVNQIMLMDCCKVLYCKTCMVNYFENNSSIQQNRVLICPTESCKRPINSIKELIRQGLLNEKIQNILKIKFKYECITCKIGFNDKKNINEEKNDHNENILTPCCNKQLCKECQQPAHQLNEPYCKTKVNSFLISIRAEIDGINNKIKLKESESEQNNPKKQEELVELNKLKRFRFCPNCFHLFFKDEKCEHVPCPKCSLQLCFACCAPRIPILGHDNSYHREECYIFKQLGGGRVGLKFEPKCQACTQNNVQCSYPPSWLEYQNSIKARFGDIFFTQEFQFNWE